ncbi:hypothetical protein cypCar_00038971 [Cyprinus carpio]|nr:hypothetical protein cypCar_00038971 [Cyprinus carpio]
MVPSTVTYWAESALLDTTTQGVEASTAALGSSAASAATSGDITMAATISDNSVVVYTAQMQQSDPHHGKHFKLTLGGKVQCSKPTKNLQFVTLSDEKTEYSNFEILTYTCNKPYNEIPRGVLMCQNGNCNGTFDCKSKICPPPPYLQHGDYSINSTKDEVIKAVSYTCQSYYVLTKQQDVYKTL